jgi:hypothetical protein
VARCKVEAGQLAQDNADALVALEDAAQRGRDLTGREGAGGDVVQERLEQMEVAAIDQGDVDRRATQLADGLKPTEATADNDDAMTEPPVASSNAVTSMEGFRRSFSSLTVLCGSGGGPAGVRPWPTRDRNPAFQPARVR